MLKDGFVFYTILDPEHLAEQDVEGVFLFRLEMFVCQNS